MRRYRIAVIAMLYLVLIAGFSLYSVHYGLPFEGLPAAGFWKGSRESGGSGVGGYGVSASHHLAVDVGMEILRRGGNAVDAAVAVGYALGVVEPYASGLGGGGVSIVYPAGEGEPLLFDYREGAPLSGGLPAGYVGVPGFVRGMAELHEKYGRLPFAELIEPAIRLAEEGFAVDRYLAERLEDSRYRLPVHELPHFYPGGKPLQAGELLVQKELAETLRRLRDEGPSIFYEGDLAAAMAARVAGLEIADLQAYRVEVKEPVHKQIAGYDFYSAPAPFSGTTLLQMVELAQRQGLLETDNRVDYIAAMAEIIRTCYRDRAARIADPAYFAVDDLNLVGDGHLEELQARLSTETPGTAFPDPDLEEDKDGNTTHFTIVDSEGTMVSTTHSISQFFGAAVYVEGYFMNNQLRGFARSERSPNRPEPGKRPRSYIAPVIMAKDGKPYMGVGTPGGKWIPMVLSQVIVNFMHGGDLQEAVAKSRFYLYDDGVLYLDEEISRQEREELRQRGYHVFVLDQPIATAVQGLVLDHERDRLYGASEYHRAGRWSVEPVSR